MYDSVVFPFCARTVFIKATLAELPRNGLFLKFVAVLGREPRLDGRKIRSEKLCCSTRFFPFPPRPLPLVELGAVPGLAVLEKPGLVALLSPNNNREEEDEDDKSADVPQKVVANPDFGSGVFSGVAGLLSVAGESTVPVMFVLRVVFRPKINDQI